MKKTNYYIKVNPWGQYIIFKETPHGKIKGLQTTNTDIIRDHNIVKISQKKLKIAFDKEHYISY